MQLSLCAWTDVGRVRTNNEDAFVTADLMRAAPVAPPGQLTRMDVGPRGALLAVSDGMGGAQAGEVASAIVVRTLEDRLATAEGPTEEVLRSAVEHANHEVWCAASEPGRRGMGATLTAVLVRDHTAYIAEVGDSRAYLFRAGRLRQMTRDQSYVQVLLDAGLLKPEDAGSSPMRSIVLQSMGQKPEVQVALGRLELRQGDRFLVCSDGLTGHVRDEEIAAALASGAPLDVVCRDLGELALERGGEDNITVVIAEVVGDSLWTRPEESVTQTFRVIQEFEPSIGGSKKPPKPAPIPGIPTIESARRDPTAPRLRRHTPRPATDVTAERRIPRAWVMIAVIAVPALLGLTAWLASRP